MALDLQKDSRGGLVPWAGVAARLPSAQQQAQQTLPAPSLANTDQSLQSAGALHGQAFCFLPLPCQTGDHRP